MTITWKPELHLQIAADSVIALRRCDVFRLIDSAENHREEMADYICTARKDLIDEVNECLAYVKESLR